MIPDSLPLGMNPAKGPFEQFRQAFSQFNERETLQPGELMNQAERLLVERFGEATEPLVRAYARGQVGLITHHTLYFEGRGILVTLTKGTAVAMRRSTAPATRIAFGEAEPLALTPSGALLEQTAVGKAARMVDELLKLQNQLTMPLDIAVASNLETDWVDSFFAALGVAVHRAATLLGSRGEGHSPSIEAAVNSLGRRISPAIWYPAEGLLPGSLLLFDTRMGTQDVLATPARTELVWGLVDVGEAAPEREAAKQAAVTVALQEARQVLPVDWGEVSRMQVNAALQSVARAHQGHVRHLLTEHHRVSPLASAITQADWQFMGGILFMSHHSLRTQWNSLNERADFVVNEVEALSEEGMYGACKMASHGTVLLAGQPLMVQRCLDRIQERFKNEFNETPRTILL